MPAIKNFRSDKRRPNQRTATGVTLIETLIAILFGAAITCTLLNLLAQTMQQSSTTQNQLYATTIAHELLESIRNEGYSYLSGIPNNAPQPLLINLNSAGPSGPAMHPAPMGLDFVNLGWTNWQSKSAEFPGTASYVIGAGPVPNSLMVTVTVQWADSQNIAGKTITTSTVLTQLGTTYWQ